MNNMIDTHIRALQTKKSELLSAQLDRDSIAVERLADTIDDIQSTNARELALVSINRHWKAVREIDAALKRIEQGVYGICDECGEEISPKRLLALPWANCCRDCQEQRDTAAEAA